MANVTPLTGIYPKQALDQVTTLEESQLFSKIRYNPDDLVQKRGLPIYVKMLNDEQVAAVCEFKTAAVVGRGWDFGYDDDSSLSSEDQDLRVRVFNRALAAMQGSFTDAIDGIFTGRDMGFSLTEKVYGQIQIDNQSYVGINELRLRNPNYFRFTTDEFGTLTKTEQRTNQGAWLDVDLDKMVRYVHKPKWDLIFGRSELRKAHRAWYIKDEMIKMWALYAEKFGGGIAVASRTSDAAPRYGTPEYETLRASLNNMASGRSIILPPNVTLDIKFPSSTDLYEKACVYHDLAIAKALLVPNLLGLSHNSGSGSLAQSETHFKAFVWTLKLDATRMEDVLNKQLFKDLGDQNWGDGEYPCFKFKDPSEEHDAWVLTTWKDFVTVNAVKVTEEDEKYVRELLGFPERDDTSTLLNDPTDPNNPDSVNHPGNVGNAANPNNPANMKQQAKLEALMTSLAMNLTELQTRFAALQPTTITVNATGTDSAAPATSARASRSSIASALSSVPVAPHGELYGVDPQRFQIAAQRVAFAVIERKTLDIEKATVARLADQVARATSRALGYDVNLQELLTVHPGDVGTMTLHSQDVSKLKATYSALLSQGWQLGSSHARNELDRASTVASNQGMTAPSTNQLNFAALNDKAAAYFDGKAFRMAGDTADAVKKIIQTQLQNAIKNGLPLSQVRADIWDALVQQGSTTKDAARGVETDVAVNQALDALWQDSQESATTYLNTLVRTNVFEALNEARFNEFSDPALGDFVEALRYAAVMDSSTTEICRTLNDSVYRTDSNVWDSYRPPNHFNCRSVLVPITAVDGWDGVESEVPTIEPAVGFK